MMREEMKKYEKVNLEANVGYLTTLVNGDIVGNHPERMATRYFYHAYPGDYLKLLNQNYQYAVAIYSLERPERYMDSYDYEREQNWSTYTQNVKGMDAYRQGRYEFTEECYFRVTLKRVDNCYMTSEEEKNVNELIGFYSEVSELVVREYNKAEIEATIRTINEKKKDHTIAFILTADTHMTVNGTWENSICNMQQVCQKAQLDGIIHLGDMTDGLVSRDMTAYYVKQMQQDIQLLNLPFFMTVGNHDTNYFRNSPWKMNNDEICNLYFAINDARTVRGEHQTWYYADFAEQKVRCIFLDTFDYNEEKRYGFPKEEISWLRSVLQATEDDYKLLIFAHDAPVAQLDYWADEIRNSKQLMNVLEEYQEKTQQIMAYIHGHTHADLICQEYSFPIVSICCAKCEGFPDKKPEGAYVPERKIGTVTEDCWDVLLFDTKENNLEFIRFGAGEDRSIK